MDVTVAGERVHAGTGGRAVEADLPLVCCIHGAGMDHTVGALPARYFAHRGCSVLAVDLPGHGKSGGAPLTPIAALADWVAELPGAAGAEHAALAGHSMGAVLVLEAAARHRSEERRVGSEGVSTWRCGGSRYH